MDHPFAITLDVGTSRANKTGSWRTELPMYVHNQPPCNQGCPAGEDVRTWLYEAEEGGDAYERAWRKIMEVNPFPAVMGRICYHPCETGCNRGQVDEAVGINSVERFLGDEALRQGWTVSVDHPSSGLRVLVVGAGPSGLSAAYQLARLGHAVTIVESAPKAGGMMRYGIPEYRLPRDVLDAEIQRILDLGVRLELGVTVTDLDATMREGRYDAAFLAVGAQIGRRAYLPAGAASHVVDAVSLLHELGDGERPLLGRRVAVYGGGNTAVDAARTAMRLGAADSVVVYRRTRDKMPAHDAEVREAEEEGVRFTWLSSITQVEQGSLTIERMELDETGFPQPTGVTEELPADSLVLALGQDTDLRFLEGVAGIEVDHGVVTVDDQMMTGRPGVFAGGDMVPDQRSATVGIGHGRRAAAGVDAWLHGRSAPRTEVRSPAAFEALNTWYFADAPRAHRPLLEAVRRSSTFDEVVQSLDADHALYEARRCMSCGNCFSCDNCFGVCPDNAISKTGDPDAPYAIDLDYCKGCGLCAAECPAGAIRMVPEEI
ncbi:NAD(P)-binding protein [Nocardioides sp. T2.26MG-1]|uniref:NAD(P)-binding protein n=1 Tax=Nocardioides sp. T2.26MG-1 TaxID=3041166 RepID=UPI00247776F4|nr:NAD(P)-binding protein [Nocardioides sp. T2.26MG-1]CAI9407821.1 NADPH-Fe(3+) oxidoreductase subunit beta [Nocardioides sp. T2.26MG-1]